ncbi:MAG: hypothetical protein CML68_00550 [Rhodobacteraceae bacterium]|nr:hypothetical protein [Paracoccaceae bacterium]
MRYYYRPVPEALKPWLGSLYLMQMDHPMSDLVRVEIPHIRFLCRGISALSHDDSTRVYRAPEALLCGPSFKTGSVRVSAGTLIVGASLTPAGWHALAAISAETMANRKQPLAELRPDLDLDPLRAALSEGAEGPGDDEALFATVTGFIDSALRRDPPPRWDFLRATMDWAVDPDSPGVAALVERTGVSSRTVDRLCRHYFGDSPKQVHRVFRALQVCHALATRRDADIADLIGPYCDQSHLIRDFKSRIGCTPERFRRDRAGMMQHDLALRAQVPDMPLYSLIG